tara:strand:- start:1735 stop:1914 length:180 start_codon:yes stop_codon:yes gene_type:complete
MRVPTRKKKPTKKRKRKYQTPFAIMAFMFCLSCAIPAPFPLIVEKAETPELPPEEPEFL